MQFRDKARSGRDSKSIARDTSQAAPSPAWLAAQQAFSQREPHAGDDPVVMVRKGRATAIDDAPAPAGAAATASQPATDKAARVFRVVAPSSAAGSLAQDPRTSRQRGQSDSRADDEPRRKRVAREKRPGPVLHIVSPVPATQPGAAAADQAPMRSDQVRHLGEVLASLDAVFADIARAQSFQFVPERED